MQIIQLISLILNNYEMYRNNRFTINMGDFQNNIEQFRGKITRIELIYIDCVNGVQDSRYFLFR